MIGIAIKNVFIATTRCLRHINEKFRPSMRLSASTSKHFTEAASLLAYFMKFFDKFARSVVNKSSAFFKENFQPVEKMEFYLYQYMQDLKIPNMATPGKTEANH